MPLKNLKKTKEMNFLKVIFNFIFVFVLFTYPVYCSELIYFASVEEKIQNGKTQSLKLYLNPVKKALTNDKFNIYYWNLVIERLPDQKKLIEKGIKIFLIKNGKLSIKSYSKKNNFNFEDTITAYFEGYFKNNVEIIKIENIVNSSKKRVYFKGLFAPLSYPDNWSRIILKNKIKSDINYFKSFF